MKRKKSLNDAIDFDDSQIEEECFIDGDIDLGGDVLESFNFAAISGPSVPKAEEAPHNCGGTEAFQGSVLKKSTKLPDYRTNHQPYGRTPPVDGEHFEIKRTFMFRRSTVRMLNYLKADR